MDRCEAGEAERDFAVRESQQGDAPNLLFAQFDAQFPFIVELDVDTTPGRYFEIAVIDGGWQRLEKLGVSQSEFLGKRVLTHNDETSSAVVTQPPATGGQMASASPALSTELSRWSGCTKTPLMSTR